MQDNLEEQEERKACQFKRSWLGECSGLRDPHYGYSQGRPCILLRMNRVRFATVKSCTVVVGNTEITEITECKLVY